MSMDAAQSSPEIFEMWQDWQSQRTETRNRLLWEAADARKAGNMTLHDRLYAEAVAT